MTVDDAFAALKIAEEKFLSVSKSKIMLLKLQLLHEHDLHRGNLKLAQRMCNVLGGLASPAMGVDMELKVEASLREARTLLAAKQYSQRLWHTPSSARVTNSICKLIHKKSGNVVLGLPYALASISFCQSFNAGGAVALHWIKPCKTSVRPFTWCFSYDSWPWRDWSCVLEHTSLKQTAICLIQAFQYHELAAEALYLMAMVYDKLGHLEEREEAAFLFKMHIIIALENPQEVEPNMA